MGTFIRKNLVLISGIVLPVLLVAGFLVLSQVPEHLAEPPQYDFLVAAYRYDPQHVRNYRLAFEVKNGRLQGQAVPQGLEKPTPYRQHARLFRYRAEEDRFEEIVVDDTGDLDDIDRPTTFTIEKTKHLQLDKRAVAPDGYSFEHRGYRGRGGLLGELFGMSRRYDSDYTLFRDGFRFELPRPVSVPSHHWQDVRFLGWVVAEDKDQ